MAMSFEFIAGIPSKKSIFEILNETEKGRQILESLRLPETKEELIEYNRDREQLASLYEALEEIDRKNKLRRALKK